jgi:hypothetical protein
MCNSDDWKQKGNDLVCSYCEKPTCGKDRENDFCIQDLGNVWNACCGHGQHRGYIQFDNGYIIRGFFIIEKDGKEIRNFENKRFVSDFRRFFRNLIYGAKIKLKNIFKRD